MKAGFAGFDRQPFLRQAFIATGGINGTTIQEGLQERRAVKDCKGTVS
jgi:hypothetical protein